MSGAGLYPTPILVFNVLDIYISFWFAMYKRMGTKNVSFWMKFCSFLYYIYYKKQTGGRQKEDRSCGMRRRGGNWYLVTDERN